MRDNINLSNNVYLSEDNNILTDGNIKISISEKEKRLLVFFLQKHNTELTKREIINSIWDKRAATIDDANLTQLIYKTRHNLSAMKMKDCIRTIPGKGYIYISSEINREEKNISTEKKFDKKLLLTYSFFTIMIFLFIIINTIVYILK